MTRRSWCAREASFSLVPAEEGGNPLPGPPPLVSLLCLAQDRAEDQREPWANKNTKAGVGGLRSRPVETPATCSTLDRLCARASILRAFRMEVPMEKGRLTRVWRPSRRSQGEAQGWGTGGLRPASTLGKKQALQRGGKNLDAVTSRDLTKVASPSSWRTRVSEVWQLQQYFQRSSFRHPNNDQGR